MNTLKPLDAGEEGFLVTCKKCKKWDEVYMGIALNSAAPGPLPGGEVLFYIRCGHCGMESFTAATVMKAIQKKPEVAN